MYFRIRDGYILSKKYEYIILDNTHLNLTFGRNTVELLDKLKAKHISLMLYPAENLTVHTDGNVHGVSQAKVEKQYNDWFNSIQEFQGIVRRYAVISRYVMENVLHLVFDGYDLEKLINMHGTIGVIDMDTMKNTL